MAAQTESLIKKTQKGLSILAFETTKQSRILKKRMRIAALQKETKADLRDLGNLVYNSIINEQAGILEEEEVKILVGNIRANKAEVEKLRDGIARLGRARKHFQEEEERDATAPAPYPDDEPPLVVDPAPRPEPRPYDVKVTTGREPNEAVLDPSPDDALAGTTRTDSSGTTGEPGRAPGGGEQTGR